MSYIKVIGNKVIDIAGIIATEEMLNDGYFECQIIPFINPETDWFEWNETKHELNIISKFNEFDARDYRNKKLKFDCDAIPPLLFDSMTAEKKTEWINYRQALLDVPQQAGFPINIIWPTKPI